LENPRFHVSKEAKEKILKIIEELNEDCEDKLWTHVDFSNNTGWEYQNINRFSPSGPDPPGPLQALVSHLLFRHGLALAYVSSPRWFPLFKQFISEPERGPSEGEKRMHWAMNFLASFCVHFAEELEGIGLPALRQFHDMDNQWAVQDPQEQALLLRKAFPGSMDKADPDDCCLFQSGRASRVSEAAIMLEITPEHVFEVYEDTLKYAEEVSQLNIKEIKGFSLYECYTSVKAEGMEELVTDGLKLVEFTRGKQKYADIRGQLRFENGYTPDFELRVKDDEYKALPTTESERQEKLAEIVRKRLRLWTTRYEEIIAAHRENTWANELANFLRLLPAVKEEARRIGQRM